VTADGPRFFDDDNGIVTHDALPGDTPVLLGAVSGGVVDAGWNPPETTLVRGGIGSIGYAAWGVFVLFLTWLVVSTLSLVAAQFDRSPAFGGVVLAAVLGGLGLLGYAAFREMRGLRALRQVDRLRLLLAGAGDLEPARAQSRVWLTRVAPHLADAAAADRAIQSATSTTELRSILRNRVVTPLLDRARRIGRNAGIQAASAVALTPHASWDGLVVGLRGLAAVREVAELFGLRPGPAVCWVLLRHISRAALETMASDLLAQKITDQFLSAAPGIRHIAAAVPEMGIAAARLYRLSVITAKECSPV
jgi:uncharacterized membrane protein YcjF (UPF0283 family)